MAITYIKAKLNSITFIARLILIKFINLLNKIQRVLNAHRILEFNSNLLYYLRGSVLPDLGGGGWGGEGRINGCK